ncbi:16S rRNA (cytosine(967)-C(5))-methyltransferase [Leptothermofonsia sichuanensis E412]|uniref:16S rRNA (cytosine(967)-C(5))-methyltransferase n=1 Tax=Leptothermofonsia sichuanensis TaxID=2917832 RepID=UPI001CA6CAA6|nr:16S rRNA (cytosine(967)-C(5))-methyltransferase [Leptothermofonsia sichuanensis]QZZ22201.1 16S rRNA (cytosine(967)-C(5))-methyltransferase [Leptothermofonsia sichuanensis E412]
MVQSARQIAFLALRNVYRGAFADVALDRVLSQVDLSDPDRRLVTELVYGSVRRLRTLDAMIDYLAKKKAHQQPPDLRTILHLGLYQISFLDQIPVSAAVNTTVELAKQNGFAGLSGFVNGLLRRWVREEEGRGERGEESGRGQVSANQPVMDSPSSFPHLSHDLPEIAKSEDLHPLSLILHPSLSPIERLGILHSYPNWIIEVWSEQLGLQETAQLCEWMNQPPQIDLRVNTLQTTLETVEAAMQSAGVPVGRVPHLPQALKLLEPVGSIQQLPGFQQGWWIVQDSSAQLVGYLVDPQPGDVIVDACAAPGGKTMHLAELMQDKGMVWACDRTPARLKKLQQNAERLGLHCIQTIAADSRNLPQFRGQCDRVLVDAPCSGLGTLHRHVDARWRQTPESVQELATLQTQLLDQAASWVKPAGILVYSTCTLHPAENETMIETFLANHPDWAIEPPPPNSPPAALVAPEGWVKVWPQRHHMDGFFMARLKKS